MVLDEPSHKGTLEFMKEFGQFDFIIVGGGTAGCLLANRLSLDPKTSVLLLEAGGKDDWVWIHIPAGIIYTIGNPRTDWCYNIEPDKGLNGRSIPYPRGRVLGGSSSINGMLYMRAQDRDYDEWSQLCGDESWSWKNVLPVFKKTENHWGGPSDFHGASGEWRVERQRISWEITSAMSDAAEEMGVPKVDDFNRGSNLGSSLLEVNQRKGIRLNSSKAFLKPVLHRRNLTVVTGAQVKKLRLENRRVTGVEFIKGDQEFFAKSCKETLLSSGAIGSPQILMLSGIGPVANLKKCGIEGANDLAGVGENLQDHLQLVMGYRVKNMVTLNSLYHSRWKKIKMALEYAAFRTGPLSMSIAAGCLFMKSDESRATANIQCHILPFGRKDLKTIYEFPSFVATVCNLRPTSRGSVSLASPDPLVHPKLTLNYLSTPEDQKVAIDSMRIIRKIVTQTHAMKKYEPEEISPGLKAQSDSELLIAGGDRALTVFHPTGTCKMGKTNDPTAVVDSNLKVIGIDGLRVVDASIMPTITSGNTSTPTLMIAERAAEMVLKSW